MLVSVGGRTRARLSIGDQSFQIVKIFDAKLSIFDGRKRKRGKGGEGERERGREAERKTRRISLGSVMAWYIVQLHALGGLAGLNVIYRRDRSFERWTVCFESPGKLLDTWQLGLLWARPEAKLTSARTGKDKVVKRYDSLPSRLSTPRATGNNLQAINPLINKILPQILFYAWYHIFFIDASICFQRMWIL